MPVPPKPPAFGPKPFFSSDVFKDQLKQQQTKIMGKMFERAQREGTLADVQQDLQDQVKQVIFELAERAKVKATLLVASQNRGVKSMESAWRKVNGVNGEAGTNWVDVRDMARCTVVVNKDAEIRIAVNALQKHFGNIGVSGFTIENNDVWNEADEAFIRAHRHMETIYRMESGRAVRDKVRVTGADIEIVPKGEKLWGNETGRQGRWTRPSVKNAGYSGATLNVSKQGWKAEIQINVPEMMYAKDLDDFEKAYGDKGPSMVAAMKTTYGTVVPGGLGHKIYERIRVLPKGDPKRVALEEASLDYYDYFRTKPVDYFKGRNIMLTLRSFYPKII